MLLMKWHALTVHNMNVSNLLCVDVLLVIIIMIFRCALIWAMCRQFLRFIAILSIHAWTWTFVNTHTSSGTMSSISPVQFSLWVWFGNEYNTVHVWIIIESDMTIYILYGVFLLVQMLTGGQWWSYQNWLLQHWEWLHLCQH